MDLIKQHRFLSAVTMVLVLATLVIWVVQKTGPVFSFSVESSDSTLAALATDEAANASAQPSGSTSSLIAESQSSMESTPETVVSPTPEPEPTTTPTSTTVETTAPPTETDINGVYQETLPVALFTPDDSTVYVRAFHANIRQEPRTDVPVLDQVSMGDTLSRSGYGSYWSQVITDTNEVGYVLTELVSTDVIYKPEPSPTPIPTKAPEPTPLVTPVAEQTETPTTATESDPSESVAPSDDAPDEITTDEFMLFARVISLEGHAPSGYESYLSVATVIMNHVAHPYFPDTVTAVISRKNAFYTYDKAAAGYPATVSDTVYQAAYDAYYNNKRNLPAYVIAFATPEAYENNVAAGGSFSKMEVYEIIEGQKATYNSVWCYYARDAQ